MAITILAPIISPSQGVVTAATETEAAVMGPNLEFGYVDSAGVHRQAHVPAATVATFGSMSDLQAWCDANLDPALPSWVVLPA